MPGYGQKNKASTDDVYFSWDDAKNAAKITTEPNKKPNTKNGAKEIIFIDRNEDAQNNSSRLLIAKANDSTTVDSDTLAADEGYYLRDFNGSESDYEYAERIRRFHDPRFTIHISDPEYMDIYFLDDDQWNVYVGGSYAWITPTWTKSAWFDYYYRPFSIIAGIGEAVLLSLFFLRIPFVGIFSVVLRPMVLRSMVLLSHLLQSLLWYPYYGYYGWSRPFYKSVDPSHNEAYRRQVANGSRNSNTNSSTRAGILSGVAAKLFKLAKWQPLYVVSGSGSRSSVSSDINSTGRRSSTSSYDNSRSSINSGRTTTGTRSQNEVTGTSGTRSTEIYSGNSSRRTTETINTRPRTSSGNSGNSVATPQTGSRSSYTPSSGSSERRSSYTPSSSDNSSRSSGSSYSGGSRSSGSSSGGGSSSSGSSRSSGGRR